MTAAAPGMLRSGSAAALVEDSGDACRPTPVLLDMTNLQRGKVTQRGTCLQLSARRAWLLRAGGAGRAQRAVASAPRAIHAPRISFHPSSCESPSSASARSKAGSSLAHSRARRLRVERAEL